MFTLVSPVPSPRPSRPGLVFTAVVIECRCLNTLAGETRFLPVVLRTRPTMLSKLSSRDPASSICMLAAGTPRPTRLWLATYVPNIGGVPSPAPLLRQVSRTVRLTSVVLLSTPPLVGLRPVPTVSLTVLLFRQVVPIREATVAVSVLIPCLNLRILLVPIGQHSEAPAFGQADRPRHRVLVPSRLPTFVGAPRRKAQTVMLGPAVLR